MTTNYILEDYPEDGSVREFWVTEDSGMRHTLELGSDAVGNPIAVWSSDVVTGSNEWETQGFMGLSRTNARQMIATLERILAETE
ncbi:hypothetical protein IPZ58_05295 [Streptomyces roseoverticillatus]|uniref:hypothetical protein n=1 Tax=Streptomyces roseoverticillatus TaxID=66429 RepID=UPI001F257D10|nr:hypothetical protein [Streptomyces roseoverticillatus]MCF3100990.1 hypothetical protein [Streptomyces roseoverticillatus]